MGKKRRVWWIVGGTLGIVVLFFVFALSIASYSYDDYINSVLSDVRDEFGFEESGSYTEENLVLGVGGDEYEVVEYSTESLTDERYEELLASLRKACRGCDEIVGFNNSGTRDDVYFERQDWSFKFRAVRVWPGPSTDGGERDTMLSVARIVNPREPTVWERVSSWWPW